MKTPDPGEVLPEASQHTVKVGVASKLWKGPCSASSADDLQCQPTSPHESGSSIGIGLEPVMEGEAVSPGVRHCL